MNKDRLSEKLERDERLTLVEQSELDELLCQDARQQEVARLLGNLPSEEPSLAWRSQLNQRLQREGARTFRGFSWLRTGLLAASTACILLAATVIIQVSRAHTVPSVSSDLLVRWHEEAAASVALPADGSSMATFAVAEQAPREEDELDNLLYGDSMESL